MSAVPARPRALTSNFRLLLTASILSNIGDGVRLSGGPLLVAYITGDALLVGMAIFVQQIPWVLIALPAGAWVDRVNRATLASRLSLARAAIALGLVIALLTGVLTVPLLFAFLFVIGIAEVIADTDGSAHMPYIVPPEQVAPAKRRFSASFFVANQLAGPALRSVLFAVGYSRPFIVVLCAFEVACVSLSVMR